MKKPAPYWQASYFSTEFINDSFNFPDPHITHEKVLSTIDVKGAWINASEGHRLTKNQPVSYEKTIWMLGGSSLVNVEVPDDFTISTFLQNTYAKDKIRVENYGYAGAQIKHQFDKLKSLKTSPGDLVIFYDGINDSIAHILLRQSLNPTDDTSIEKLMAGSFFGVKRLLVLFFQKMRAFLNSIHFFRFWFGEDPTFILQNQVPNHLLDQASLDLLKLKMKDQVTKELLEVSRYCQENNLEFIHIFQPILNLSSKKSQYEKLLIQSPSIIPASFDYTFKHSKSVFSSIHQNLLDKNISSYLLLDSLIERPKDAEIFLDFGHLNHIGNQLMAQKISSIIQDSKFTYASKEYVQLFQSLDKVGTDHNKAKNYDLSANGKKLCKFVPKEIFKTNDPTSKLLEWEKKLCYSIYSEDYCDHTHESFLKRVLIRWMLDKNCRGIK